MGGATLDTLYTKPSSGAGDEKELLKALGKQFQPSSMHWIAYMSNESGRYEVYVRPFVAAGPGGVPVLGEGKWQVSREGGDAPHRSADGKRFLVAAPQGEPVGPVPFNVMLNWPALLKKQ